MIMKKTLIKIIYLLTAASNVYTYLFIRIAKCESDLDLFHHHHHRISESPTAGYRSTFSSVSLL